MSASLFLGVGDEFCRFYVELVPHLRVPSPRSVVYVRAGDFYVALGEPASEAVRALGIMPTEYRGLLAIHAFPLHAVDTYIRRLRDAGLTVVVVFISDPK